MARGTSSALAGGMDTALPPDVSLYRRADRRRISDEHRLSARGPRARLPSLFHGPLTLAAIGGGPSTLTHIFNELVRGLSRAPISLGCPSRSWMHKKGEGSDVASVDNVRRGKVG